MIYSYSNIKFKNSIKLLNMYSIPSSTLFIVRKRLNFIFLTILSLFIFIVTIV